MELIYWAIVGLIAGAGAKAVVPGDEGGGWISSIILGVVGAIVGGLLLTKLGFLSNIIVAFAGAVLVLAAWNALTKNRKMKF
jgi:uncharacterized membrane protein YeaQ/YmgE (transglycosylase-associated protein family)